MHNEPRNPAPFSQRWGLNLDHFGRWPTSDDALLDDPHLSVSPELHRAEDILAWAAKGLRAGIRASAASLPARVHVS